MSNMSKGDEFIVRVCNYYSDLLTRTNKMNAVERIVFMQGDEASKALDILETFGLKDAVEYLAQWHNPGSQEEADEPAAGSSDSTYETEDGFILTWNDSLGYIGLERRITT